MTHKPMQRKAFRPLLLSLFTVAALALPLPSWAADAPAPELAKARSLLEAGRATEALELLEPLEPKLAGDLEYDYLLGIAALNANQPSKATFIFERVLAVAPDLLQVRADMGKAYYMLGDYGRAKIEFETLLTIQNLPPDLKGTAEKYMDALAGGGATGTALTGYIEAGFGRDTNTTSGTRINPINTSQGPQYLDSPYTPRRDNYKTLATGFDLSHALADGFSVYAGGDYRGRFYNNVDTSDYNLLDGRAGIGYSSGGSLLKVGMLGGYYVLDNQMARTNWGGNLDYRYALNATNQLLLGASVIQYTFTQPNAENNNYLSMTGNIGWFGSLTAQSAMSANLIFGHEKANGVGAIRADGDKDFFGARMSYQTTITTNIGAFASVGAQRARYQRYNTDYVTLRRDNTYDLSMGLSIGLGDRWSLRPMYSMLKNTSTTDLSNYLKNDLSLNLRKDF